MPACDAIETSHKELRIFDIGPEKLKDRYKLSLDSSKLRVQESGVFAMFVSGEERLATPSRSSQKETQAKLYFFLFI